MIKHRVFLIGLGMASSMTLGNIPALELHTRETLPAWNWYLFTTQSTCYYVWCVVNHWSGHNINISETNRPGLLVLCSIVLFPSPAHIKVVYYMSQLFTSTAVTTLSNSECQWGMWGGKMPMIGLSLAAIIYLCSGQCLIILFISSPSVHCAVSPLWPELLETHGRLPQGTIFDGGKHSIHSRNDRTKVFRIKPTIYLTD